MHGGQTWMRLKFANGSIPLDLHAAITLFMASLLAP
ncbi:Uncharacterised protein [Mycobacteroides abscessus subsp. abscessus]|nr:Uncharacterised protein [Mycobacteroides abscessus subsp. abscessus]